MERQTIVCPRCAHEIPLSDALGERIKRELAQQLRHEFDHQLEALQRDNQAKDQRLAEMEQAELALRQERQALEEARRRQELDVARRIDEGREQIRAQALKDAWAEHRLRGAERERQLMEQLRALKHADEQKQHALQQMEQRELALLKEKEALETERRRIALDAARQLEQERARIRKDAVSTVEEQYKLQVSEKDKQMADLREQLELVKRKADQSSQQLQGEVLELNLEELLRAEFPSDTIEPVAKGVRGADVLQQVRTASGRLAGTIVWEAKRTRNWSDGWLQKLRDDQRQINADIAVLITDALPKDVRHFAHREGIVVTGYACVAPLAVMLRESVLRLGQTKHAMVGSQRKADVLYEYLTSIEFRHRFESIAESFVAMKQDLEQERRAMERLWSKREKEIGRVLHSISGMYGDLQGIVGNSLPTIGSLSLPEEPAEALPATEERAPARDEQQQLWSDATREAA